jgi:glycosyltransferase involved in cell wall biosynthesis
MASSIRLAVLVTEDWYLCSHRLPILRGAVRAGYEVLVLTHVGAHAEEIRATGARLVAIPLDRSNVRPIKELVAVWRIVQAIARFRPHVIHNVALKPILYGTLAGHLARTKLIVNALAGLGDLYMRDGGMARQLLRRAVALALKSGRTRVLVQNPEDAGVVMALGVASSNVDLIPGAGVSLSEFTAEAPPAPPPFRVLFVGRLLVSKGLHELHDAAVRLRRLAPDVRIQVAGGPDPHNPGCIGNATLQAWADEGALQFLGRRTDIPALLKLCHLVVLPSYREGVPKALLEATAAGRPIVATDVPGNREVVEHGVNGLLVPVRDVDALISAIIEVVRDPDRRISMGTASRRIAEENFSEDAVVSETLSIYENSGVG